MKTYSQVPEEINRHKPPTLSAPQNVDVQHPYPAQLTEGLFTEVSSRRAQGNTVRGIIPQRAQPSNDQWRPVYHSDPNPLNHNQIAVRNWNKWRFGQDYYERPPSPPKE